MSKVSAVIVTIGSKDYVFRCIESLLKQTCLADEIIVIDNSLDPLLSSKLRKMFPQIKVYSQEKNLFYSPSLNKGLELSAQDFILCLNDDIILDSCFISKAMDVFSRDAGIGMSGGKVLRSNAKILDSCGLFLTFWRTAKDRGYGQKDRGQFNKAGYVFGINGSAVIYRRKMLEKIKDKNGYFDSRFLMFYEDLDLSWRAKKQGWLAYYVPEACAYHVRGGSFRPDAGKDKAIARRYLNSQLHLELIKNRHLAILKNESFFSFLLHFIPILVYDTCVFVYILLFRPKEIRPVLKV